jgi:flagellar basal-body rod modification protein FlgD
MQYQDPLEPTDNTEYIAQMATFTQVSATTNMNTNVMREMASNLVGKTVIVKSDIDSTQYVAGQVQSWEKANDGIYLRINDKLYDIEDLDRVLDESYYEELLKNNSVG